VHKHATMFGDVGMFYV